MKERIRHAVCRPYSRYAALRRCARSRLPTHAGRGGHARPGRCDSHARLATRKVWSARPSRTYGARTEFGARVRSAGLRADIRHGGVWCAGRAGCGAGAGAHGLPAGAVCQFGGRAGPGHGDRRPGRDPQHGMRRRRKPVHCLGGPVVRFVWRAHDSGRRIA